MTCRNLRHVATDESIDIKRHCLICDTARNVPQTPINTCFGNCVNATF
jgi:hypothetical protein